MITQTLTQALAQLSRAAQAARTAVGTAGERLASLRTAPPRGPRMRRPVYTVRQVEIQTSPAVIRAPSRSRGWRLQVR